MSPTIRGVGFRSGTDAELRMLQAVEAPVEAERRPDREPQPVESYIALRPQAGVLALESGPVDPRL